MLAFYLPWIAGLAILETWVEPPRVCRRLHRLRRWSHDKQDLDLISPEVRTARFGWFWSTAATMPRAGRRLIRFIKDRLYAADIAGVGQVGRDRQRQRIRRATDVSDELKALERENRELRQANEILRKASIYFAQAELDRRFKP